MIIDYVYFMILPFLSNQTEYVSWYPLFFFSMGVAPERQ
jgi:hypothetical protein